MSDLAATNCGCSEERCERCGCDNNCSNGWFGFGHNNCSCILWIIILFALCGNNNWGGNNCGCGNNGDCCWIIIVLLLLCGNGFGNNCGCC
ncbi:MAG: hypothetical protein SOY73_12570 [Blautia sp.]|nr:hypothetical protein [Blautia sp.]MDY3999899.1 hypothetical protein [Blautia sp.]